VTDNVSDAPRRAASEDAPKQSNWNVPNVLTVIRIILVPVYVVLMFMGPDDFTWRLWATIVFVLAMLTDVADGNIARKYNLVTDFGKLWDPVAGRVGLLDLDTAAYGEPALDLANLAVHVDLRVLQGVLPVGVARSVAVLLDAVADAVGASPGRLAVHRRSARLRLACVYAFRPASARWLDAWVDSALAA